VDGPFDFESAERRIHEAVANVKAAALAEVLVAAKPRSSLIEVDGDVYKRMSETSMAEYLARCGAIHIERPLYRQVGVHNGPTVDPIAL